jgi:glycosyltransferase involved in cell wall biosynthesis
MEERQIVTRLSECDLVVLAYTHSQEASSAAIRMPLASMTPVLCSDLPIFDEFAEAVHRFPAGNTVELAQRILTLASNRELLRSKSKAHADLVESLSWEKIAYTLCKSSSGKAREFRFRLYAVRAGRLLRADVEHQPWPLSPGDSETHQ